MSNTVFNSLSINGNKQDVIKLYNKISSGEIYLGNIHGKLDYDDKVITFNSRTAPPCEVLLNISKEFKDVTFYLSYNEPLGGFLGEFECKNGVIIRDKYEETLKELSKNEMLNLMNELNEKYTETWIKHHLTLTGSGRDISSLILSAIDSKCNNIIDFSRIVPVPSEDELKQMRTNINDWFRKNYGISTTYGLLTQDPVVEDSRATLIFYLKDTPSTELFLKLSEQYRGIEFHSDFEEVFGKYDGTFHCIQGKTICNAVHHKGIDYIEFIPESNRNIDTVELIETYENEREKQVDHILSLFT